MKTSKFYKSAMLIAALLIVVLVSFLLVKPAARLQVKTVSVPAGQFFPIEISVANTQLLLKAGMTAYANIVVETSRPILAISKNALLERDGRQYVFVLKDGRAKLVPVLTGLSGENDITILEGLSRGDQVIVSGAGQVMEGQPAKAKSFQ
ncbi:MAG: hypothetical protein QHH10_13615 [Peptococcaceae bacterium]|jgi:hypothetical protein|nr:hypothetical protein [Peptococcaceae bacterium]MDH7526332.1 hypothetical protein [Peptococcaceae bacterium]